MCRRLLRDMCHAVCHKGLGPILFLLYTADIERIVSKHELLCHCYADDTQLYFFCPPAEVAALKQRVTNCITEISTWMSANKLQLNQSKTEFIWCTMMRRQHLRDHDDLVLPCGTVTPVDAVRNLGFHLDSSLSMSTHVSHLIRNCFYQLRRIRSIRGFITKTAVRLVNSFVVSRVDYCNGLLTGLPAYQLDRLQSVLHSAARHIYGR